MFIVGIAYTIDIAQHVRQVHNIIVIMTFFECLSSMGKNCVLTIIAVLLQYLLNNNPVQDDINDLQNLWSARGRQLVFCI
jgi:hypothetical protein